MFKKYLPFIFLGIIVFAFFWKVFLKGLVPIPADTVVGLYHPFRDYFSNEYVNGVPFKNFLITDPVRQQIPWRELSVNLSTWNPYSFSGAPLLPNIQSAYFYPFNFTFFIFNFLYSWIFLIIAQVMLAALFLYFYLRNLKIDKYSSIFGSIVFAFGGFSAMWLEWGTVMHSALWLPLALLSIDKVLLYSKNNRNLVLWSSLLVISMSSSLFAGHLQTFFYLSIFVFIYFLSRLYQSRNKRFFVVGIVAFFITLIITSIQWVPTLKLISLSARSVDQQVWQKEGWFLPYEHIVQFIVPDFFGNPTTLNYWGTWNYGELTGYVGIVTLIFAFFAMYFRRDKKTLFFGSAFFVAIIMALPTFIAKVPFLLDLPFISTAQPTRLLFIATFALAVLSAFGLNHFLKIKSKKNILLPIIAIVVLYGIAFAFTLIGERLGIDPADLSIARRNMILPFILICASSILIIGLIFNKKRIAPILLSLIILLLVFDMFRFSWKFNTFASTDFLYPETSTISYLKKNIGNNKFATTDSRIMAPNFSVIHKLPGVEGYDPIYLQRYGELISAINRGGPDISTPFGFNRIVRIENFESPLINMLGIKYVLSLNEIDNDGYSLVHEEGQTKVYENTNALPFAYFVDEVKLADDKQSAINVLFEEGFDSSRSAVVETSDSVNSRGNGVIVLKKVSDYEYKIRTSTKGSAFMVIIDSYYPTWEAGLYNEQGDMIRQLKIYRTNYNFKGIQVPPGDNLIFLRNKIL